MTEPLRIAQIGIAHTHANKLAASTSSSTLARLNVELAGIYEPDREMWNARHGYPEFLDVYWIDTVEDVFDDPTIKAVFIETWPWDSQEWARRALEAGKHIHLDKPPGTSLHGLRSLYDLAARKGLFIQMGYQWRFNAGFELLQKIVHDGFLGRVTFASFRAGSTPEYYHRNHVNRFPGGILQEESSHLFDQVVWMFGRPDGITPFRRSDARGFDAMPEGVDNAVVVFEFEEKGAMAIIEATSLETDPGPHRRVAVHGLNGSVILEPIEPPLVDLSLREPKGLYRVGWQKVPVENRPRYVGDIEEFVGVVRGERKPRFSREHDLLVQETLIRSCGGDL